MWIASRRMVMALLIALAPLLASCGSFDFGDALDAAAVASEASDHQYCRDLYRRSEDRAGYQACLASIGR